MKRTKLGNILIIILIVWVLALFIFPSLRFTINAIFSQLPLIGPWFDRFTEPLIEEFYTHPFILSFYPSILLTALVVLLISWNALARGTRLLFTRLAQHKMKKKAVKEVQQHMKKDDHQ
jgi:hypothetical protein